VNGEPVMEPVEPGSFLRLRRTWADGDVVSALFPPALRFEQLNDARANFSGVGSILFGGVMLALVNGTTDAFPLDTSAAGLARAFSRVPAAPPAGGDYGNMVFSARGANGAVASFIPLADVAFEQYAAYVRTAGSVATGAAR